MQEEREYLIHIDYQEVENDNNKVTKIVPTDDEKIAELRKVLLDLKVDIKNDSVNPSGIEDRLSDFKMINDIWHFKNEIADNLIHIINEADGYYRLLDTDDYYAKGNVNDIFRIVKKNEEIILIEFYACD